MERKKNNLLLLAIKATVSLALLYIIFKKAGIDRISAVIGTVNPVFFLAASLTYLFGQFVSSIRWWVLLPDDIKPEGLSISRLYGLYLMGSFFNNILPGIVGGDALRVYYLYKDDIRGASAFGSVFADRYIGYCALITLGILSIPFVSDRLSTPRVVIAVPAMALVFIVASIVLFGVRWGHRFKSVRGFYDYILALKKAPRRLFYAYLLSIVIQVAAITSVFFVMQSLKVDVNMIELFFFMPLVITISSIPVSISGLGLREGSFVVLLSMVGIGSDVATAISLLWFLSYVVGSLPGLPIYLKWSSKGGVNS